MGGEGGYPRTPPYKNLHLITFKYFFVPLYTLYYTVVELPTRSYMYSEVILFFTSRTV